MQKDKPKVTRKQREKELIRLQESIDHWASKEKRAALKREELEERLEAQIRAAKEEEAPEAA
jgi:hypothetical protein